MIHAAIQEGRRFARVRVVSLPLTDYSRFGVFCSQFTDGAGEDIRYLVCDQAHVLTSPITTTGCSTHPSSY